MITLKNFLFDLLILGFTIEKGGFTFRANHSNGDSYLIQPQDGGWIIGQVSDKWAKEIQDGEPIQSFHQKYFTALTGV